ncbi:MAG: NPCBM/NEW2 domain-containing protein [Thermogemmata sp.]|jgi:hypothetical protein|nr:NPCBM/NEW2 domain-containing protein [Gemmataceae bacterium]GIW85287.1 MAG: hypothetical protein KatS3mg107_0947 [Gemmataceae bacterium]
MPHDKTAWRRFLGTVMLTFWGVALSLSAAEVITLDGKKLAGDLLAVEKERITLRVGQAQVQIPNNSLLAVELGRTVPPLPKGVKYHEIELTDGSTLRVSRFSIKQRRVECELLSGPEDVPPPRYDLSLDVVFFMMKGAEDPAVRQAWKKMLNARGKRDLYVIREGDTLNFLQGTIHGGTPDGARLDFERAEGERVSLLQSRATGGLVLAHPPRGNLPPKLCKVIDVFGNQLVAQSMELTEGGVLVTTVAGVRFHYPKLAALARLDFSLGNLAYLSDLPLQITAPELPAEEKELRLHLHLPVLKDRGLSGEVLKVAGQPPFTKGLLIAPDTVITVEPGGEYREFQAIAGLPESVLDGQLAVQLTVEGDGRVLFQQTLRRKDPPKPLALDIQGVRQLRLIVEGDFAVNGNRLILGNARFVK